MNVGSVLDRAVTAVPDRTALVDSGQHLSYAQLDQLADRCAAKLHRGGVRQGDRVAVIGPGGAAAVAAIVGIARLGASSAQMNPQLTAGEVRTLGEMTGVSAGFVGTAHAARLRTAFQGPVVEAETVIAEGPDGPVVPRPGIDDDACGLILFSSGTTGLPKPVLISHRTVADRLNFYGAPIDAATEPPVDMMTVPLFHIGGCLGLLITMHSGKTMVMLPRFDAAAWLQMVEEHRVSQTFLVPTMLKRILDHPDFARRNLSSLRSISYGAAPASPELIERALSQLPGVDFTNVFGQTETLGAYAALSPADHREGTKLDSVGRPFPGVELRVVDVETGENLGPGLVGEAVVRAAQNVTAGWLRTGDLVSLDRDGYIFIKGRVKDTINRGGEKFGPLEIEVVIAGLPGVEEVAVAGFPDNELGERVAALIVANRRLGLEDVRTHCEQFLARFKVPEIIVFVDELPVNEYGKIPRSAIVEVVRSRRTGAVPQ